MSLTITNDEAVEVSEGRFFCFVLSRDVREVMLVLFLAVGGAEIDAPELEARSFKDMLEDSRSRVDLCSCSLGSLKD